MTFVLATIVIVFGTIVFSLVVSNILLVIFFAIPLTKKLDDNSLLKSGNKNKIVKKYTIVLLVQLLVLFIITLVFYIYFRNSAFISLLIGYAFGFLSIIKNVNSFKFNANNISDYFETNREYFWEELVAKYDEDKDMVTRFIIKAVLQSFTEGKGIKSKGSNTVKHPERMSEQVTANEAEGYIDKYYLSAERLSRKNGYASPALFQRELKISYQIASLIVEKLYDKGVIEAADGARPRKVVN